MHSVSSIDYEKIGRKNLKRALTLRKYHKILNEKLKTLDKDSVVIIESPAENYIEANISSVKSMVENGFEGIYLSFQRPFKNISNLFEKEKIDLTSLYIVDCATAFSESDQERSSRCININPNVNVDEMVNTICNSLQKLNKDKRFIFIDSLSTLSLHEPFTETLRFPELLLNTIKKRNIHNVICVFNIAKHLIGKRYVENLNVYANEYIHLGLCT
jgi:hypothetical protein